MSNDLAFLREKTRPGGVPSEPAFRIVDLFAGAGGLTLGIVEAGRRLGLSIEVALAVDSDQSAVEVFRCNFPKANVLDASKVESIFDGELGAPLTSGETQISGQLGAVDWLHGGPPCQGHSDLNNHTRRDDPRNIFYERMARAAEVLKPRVVLIENVPPVRNAKARVVDNVTETLECAGYDVADEIIDFSDLGVPQKRRRHAVLGLRGFDVRASAVLSQLAGQPQRTVRWGIEDLVAVDETLLDTPSRMTADNVARAKWLMREDAFDLPNDQRPKCHRGDHSYVSMYGRMRWDEPAQTVTSGYGSMGQGRYLHPSQSRTITPHEAARLQFFPDWFDFTAGGLETRRGKWAMMIGNAVPPKLTMELGKLLLPHMAE